MIVLAAGFRRCADLRVNLSLMLRGRATTKNDASRMGRILVVDDEQDNLDVLERRLNTRGFEVITAKSGQEALSIVDAAILDLVLLDVMMPGMSGLDVLHEIRRARNQATLPVIMVTAKGDQTTTASSIGKGANDFVVKPFDFEVLLSRVMMQLHARASLFRSHSAAPVRS